MPQQLRLGVLQLSPKTGDIAENLRRIEGAVRQSPAGSSSFADLLLLPEMCLTGLDYPRMRDLAVAALPALGELADMLAPHATAVGLTVPALAGRGVTNRFVLINQRGAIIQSYDKIHRIGHGGFRETRFIQAGSKPLTFRQSGWLLGAAICYDLRFPEVFRNMIRRAPSARADRPGKMVAPDILLLPAQWPHLRQQALLTLARARAIENQAFFAVANATGTSGSLKFSGESCIFGPAGEELLKLGQRPGWGIVEIYRKALLAYRKSFPALQDTVLL